MIQRQLSRPRRSPRSRGSRTSPRRGPRNARLFRARLAAALASATASRPSSVTSRWVPSGELTSSRLPKLTRSPPTRAEDGGGLERPYSYGHVRAHHRFQSAGRRRADRGGLDRARSGPPRAARHRHRAGQRPGADRRSRRRSSTRGFHPHRSARWFRSGRFRRRPRSGHGYRDFAHRLRLADTCQGSPGRAAHGVPGTRRRQARPRGQCQPGSRHRPGRSSQNAARRHAGAIHSGRRGHVSGLLRRLARRRRRRGPGHDHQRAWLRRPGGGDPLVVGDTGRGDHRQTWQSAARIPRRGQPAGNAVAPGQATDWRPGAWTAGGPGC